MMRRLVLLCGTLSVMQKRMTRYTIIQVLQPCSPHTHGDTQAGIKQNAVMRLRLHQRVLNFSADLRRTKQMADRKHHMDNYTMMSPVPVSAK